MQEIEVKARIKDKEKIIEALNKLGVILSKPVAQKDICFSDQTEDYEKFLPGFNFLRIREQEGRFILTFKRSLKNELDSIEHETEISNPTELSKIIELLGFPEVVRINKIRQKAKYKDLEICVDEVEGLGCFIEVEKLVDEGDSETIQGELFNFLQSLGVEKSDEVTQGYDTLVYIAQKSSNR